MHCRLAEEDLVHVFRLGRRGDENNLKTFNGSVGKLQLKKPYFGVTIQAETW